MYAPSHSVVSDSDLQIMNANYLAPDRCQCSESITKTWVMAIEKLLRHQRNLLLITQYTYLKKSVLNVYSYFIVLRDMKVVMCILDVVCFQKNPNNSRDFEVLVFKF